MTKPTGKPVGRTRKDGLPAGSPRIDELADDRAGQGAQTTAREIGAALSQMGAGQRGEIDVWIERGGAWAYLDTPTAAEFSLAKFQQDYGEGRFRCDVYTVEPSGTRRKTISKIVLIAAKPQRGTAAAAVAGPVQTPAQQALDGAMLATVGLMTTAMGGMAKMFSELRPPAPTDPLELIAKLAPILKPDSGAQALALLREGMQFGRELGDGGSEASPWLALASALKPAMEIIARRVEQLPVTAEVKTGGEVKQLPTPVAAGQAASAGVVAPPVPAADSGSEGDVMERISRNVKLLGPYIAFKLRAEDPDVDALAVHLLDDLRDMLRKDYDQLLAIAGHPQFVEITVSELGAAVPAELHPLLRKLVEAVQRELKAEADGEDAPAAAAGS